MSKIIIDNRSDLPDIDAIDVVKRVVKMGRISNNDSQYCYLSVLTVGDTVYRISTDLNKKSDRFLII